MTDRAARIQAAIRARVTGVGARQGGEAGTQQGSGSGDSRSGKGKESRVLLLRLGGATGEPSLDAMKAEKPTRATSGKSPKRGLPLRAVYVVSCPPPTSAMMKH